MTDNKKTTIVLIHHFGGTGETWKWVVKRLSKTFNIVQLTLPGFGNTEPLKTISIRSMSEWISNQIRQLKIEDYILVGHSMGGKLALFTSFILYDLQPRKLVLISPSPLAESERSGTEYLETIDSHDRLRAEKIINYSMNKKLKASKYKHLVDSQLKVDRCTSDWWINEGVTEDITWAIKNISMPTYLIVSSNDPIMNNIDVRESIFPFLNKAKLMSFGRAGHMIPVESSRKLARILSKISKEKEKIEYS